MSGGQVGSAELFSSDEALDKFQAAGEVANQALKALIAKCVPGADVATLCQESDEHIGRLISNIYKKKQCSRGVSFPTCISINEVMGHFCPLTSGTELKDGDLIKIDLGAHLDGYPAWVGHTLQVGEGKVTGRKADVLMAAHTAMEAAVKTIQPGKTTNYDVTNVMEKVYAHFDCRGVHGVLSHECGKNLVDSPDRIIQNCNIPDEKPEEFTFAPYQCFLLQVMASTGTGKPRETSHLTTLHKHDPDNSHPMKTPYTRQFVSAMLRNHPVFPFHNREFDAKIRTVGLAECIRHYMVQAFPVVSEAADELVASFTTTVIIYKSKNGDVRRVTGLPIDLSKIEAEHRVEADHRVTDEQLLTLLSAKASSGSKLTKSQKEQ